LQQIYYAHKYTSIPALLETAQKLYPSFIDDYNATYIIFAPAMKTIVFPGFIFLLLFFSACSNNKDQGVPDAPAKFPKPGTIIATASRPVADDSLNKFTYSIKIIADSNIISGVYDVDADYGPNFAEGQFTMPKGGEHLVPLIRKGSDPFTYVIGFKVAGDTTFYDYFEVMSNHSTTKMQYLKTYTF